MAATVWIWAELMHRLGYDRYGTQGGDLGAYVAPEVAKLAPDHVAGVHVISGLGFPTQDDVPGMTADERAAYARLMDQDWVKGVDHHGLLRAAPQTFAYGWHDSKVAALAWIVQKFHEVNPSGEPLERVIGRDPILTNVRATTGPPARRRAVQEEAELARPRDALLPPSPSRGPAPGHRPGRARPRLAPPR